MSVTMTNDTARDLLLEAEAPDGAKRELKFDDMRVSDRVGYEAMAARGFVLFRSTRGAYRIPLKPPRINVINGSRNVVEQGSAVQFQRFEFWADPDKTIDTAKHGKIDEVSALRNCCRSNGSKCLVWEVKPVFPETPAADVTVDTFSSLDEMDLTQLRELFDEDEIVANGLAKAGKDKLIVTAIRLGKYAA